MDLKGRDFLTLKDYTPEEILYLIDLAAELKDKKKKGIVEQPLIGKNVALIFEKTSTRTRCSFEWQHMTLVWVLHILTLQVHRLARRRALLIQQEFSVQCLKESNTEDSVRR